MTNRFKSTNGNDTFLLRGLPEKINGGLGSDTFIVDNTTLRNFIIDGGTPVSGEIDRLQFNKTGIFTLLTFRHIERIDLAEGVSVTLTNQQLKNAIDSLDTGDSRLNFECDGTSGGQQETLRVIVNYEQHTFTPEAQIKGAIPQTYQIGSVDLSGALFHNVLNNEDFYKGSSSSADDDENDTPALNNVSVSGLLTNVATEADDDDTNTATTESQEDHFAVGFYASMRGSDSDDSVLGSRGIDNAVLGAGNDTFLGNEGNDLIVGGQGADSLDGGTGNDIFLITHFDSHPDWVDGDVIIGGAGIDTLRITKGAATKTTLVLTNDNFQSMESVEIGTTVDLLNVEDSALQLMNNHYYLNARGAISGKETADNVIVDASGLDNNGLTFIGNENNNTFIGTHQDDTLIGNGGNDTLTGGEGADTFVFGKVHTQTVSGNATNRQTYQDVTSDLSGVDTMTDFKAEGQDQIVLEAEMFSALENGLSEDNFVIGTKAHDANDYLIFNPSTKILSYDDDGIGSDPAVPIVKLIGVTELSIYDFFIH